MSLCVPTRVTTIQAAEREVADARRVLQAADGVEWVSDAADRFRAMLTEALGATAYLAHALESAFRAVDAAHVAVDEAARGTAAARADPWVRDGFGVSDRERAWLPGRMHP